MKFGGEHQKFSVRYAVLLWGGLCLLMILSACSLAPTKAHETRDRRFDGTGALAAPVKITSDTIIVDARSRFEYSVAHVPKSVSLQWWDFTEPEFANRGVLRRDLDALVRRLAIAGLSPSSHIVVIGKGLGAQGEEGRVAWMLGYLGFTNVQFAAVDSLKLRYTNVMDENALKSVQPWSAEPVPSLLVTREELQSAINASAAAAPAAAATAAPTAAPMKVDKTNTIYRIIDVRESKDYLGKSGLGAERTIPNMGAVNIPWMEFFDSSMRPRPQMLEKLKQVGIEPHHRVIVLDAEGVSSGGVTLALRALGFANAGHYAGGLRDLLSAYR